MDVKPRQHNLGSAIRCAICRTDITHSPKRYQFTFTSGAICSRCRNRFNEEDLIIINNLFFVYGGYFGKYPRYQFDLLSQMIEILEKQKRTSSLEVSNTQLLHQALLHGITPHEFQEMVRAMI
jgi:hypothetical protein